MANFTDQASAIAILLDCFAGFVLGIVGCAVFGSLKEDRRTLRVRRNWEREAERDWVSLREEPRDPISAGVRVMFAVPEYDDLRGQGRPPQHRGTANDPRGDNPYGPDGQEVNR
jgi:hypothetical protein